MQQRRRRTWLLAMAMALSTPLAFAQDAGFPTRSVRVIVPFGAGSGSDANARFVATKLTTLMGQSVYVENRPGASGSIGLQAAKTFPADGYTIVQGSISPMTVNPVMMKELLYDPVADFKPLFGMARSMNVVVVSSDSKFKTLADLIEGAKGAKPLNVGTFSAGYQIAAAWLASDAGVKFVNIPYKGQGLVMTDVMGKQLDFAVVDLAGVGPLLSSGKVRALAVSGETRHPDFPDIPTIKETFPDYVQYSWNAFYVRAQTPDDVSAKLSEGIKTVMATAEGKAMMKSVGSEFVPLAPAEMKRFTTEELARFRRIAKDAGIQPE